MIEGLYSWSYFWSGRSLGAWLYWYFPISLPTIGPLWWWVIQFHFQSWHWKIHRYLQCEKKYVHILALKLDLEPFHHWTISPRGFLQRNFYKNSSNTFLELGRTILKYELKFFTVWLVSKLVSFARYFLWVPARMYKRRSGVQQKRWMSSLILASP